MAQEHVDRYMRIVQESKADDLTEEEFGEVERLWDEMTVEERVAVKRRLSAEKDWWEET